MATPKAIGAIELSSIGIGYQIEDEMLKAASVELLIARTICSGKYLIVIGGSVSDVEAAIQAGLGRRRRGDHRPPDHAQRPRVGLSRRWASRSRSGRTRPGALGVVETFSGVSVLAAADAAAKAARVTLFRIHVAMALGGKGLCLMTGTVADVRPACRSPPTKSAAAACWSPRSSSPVPAGNCSAIICRLGPTPRAPVIDCGGYPVGTERLTGRRVSDESKASRTRRATRLARATALHCRHPTNLPILTVNIYCARRHGVGRMKSRPPAHD